MTDRLGQIHDWLCKVLGPGGFRLSPASADASFRRYFRVHQASGTLIVMDAPPEHEDCGPYIDISARLQKCGVNVPAIRARDLERGFLLLDDLGTDLYLEVLDEASAGRLYAAAVEALLAMQSGADRAGLPPYDERLLRAEMNLFRDWLLDHHLQQPLTGAAAAMLEDCFALLVDNALAQPRCFVHRDYHSRNLLAGPGALPGIVDFQDAVLGPVTYDLVSLFKDCYIKWPRARVVDWALEYRHRAQQRDLLNAGQEQFLRWFDLMGVQRQLKASGIFARLCHRDGKTAYLKDIPRTLSYILDLKQDYPEIRRLAELIEDQVVPRLGCGDAPCAP